MALTDEQIYGPSAAARQKAAAKARLDAPVTVRDVRRWAYWLAAAWMLSKIMTALGCEALFH